MQGIRTLVLNGTKYAMGIEYGKQLKLELLASLEILKEFFIQKHNLSIVQLLNQANLLYNKYPPSFQKFIKGLAKGSGISLTEAKILNAMETLNALINKKEILAACAFLAAPSCNDTHILGRNYDFAQPYDQIAKYLTITIIKENGKIPVAIIALPGQIYAPTAINKHSLFLELNNGMPSGGYEVNHHNQSLLINMLIALQTSKSTSELDQKLSLYNSDLSLIINSADQNTVKSYEYSSLYGLKSYVAEKTFVSTNFYLNYEWNLPSPDDESTWHGVSRRNNLLKQIKNTNSAQTIMDILDTKLSEGGAKWENTIYQIVFDPSNKDLYVKRTKEEQDWNYINLSELL